MTVLSEAGIYLPSYLSDEGKEALLGQLERFKADGSWQPYGTGSVYPSHVLQGDAIVDLPIIQLPNPAIKNGLGLIISNTCDIDSDNARKVPANVAYCPLIQQSKFETLIHDVYGGGAKNFIEVTKAQLTTNVIYFPSAGTEATQGHYALLDRVCHVARSALDGIETRKTFTLSQVGFYLFLLKLSIHFTRMKEGIVRDAG